MTLSEESLRDQNGVPYYMWRMKMFDGRSAFDLMSADRLEQHHIDALIAEARLMDQSKAKPTNDSAPYQFELDFGDE